MNYFIALLKNKCPRCREGDVFCTTTAYKKGFMKMPKNCPHCGQRTEIEPGFYYGAAYVSYALTVAISVASFIAWWTIVGLSLDDNRLFWWLGLNAVLLVFLQPWLMRLSRTIWLSFFVKYNPVFHNELEDSSTDQ
jgi:uncharacterized protein (DUF983 family)